MGYSAFISTKQHSRCTKRHFDELCKDDRLSNACIFYAAVDTAIAQVTHRFQGMQEVARRFGFLRPQELLLKFDGKL